MDPGHEVRRWGVLQQEAGRSGGEGAKDEVVGLEGGEDHHRGRVGECPDPAGGLHTIAPRHPHVHEDHCRCHVGHEFDGGDAVLSLAHDLDARCALQDEAQACADEGLVVHEDHAHGCRVHHVSHGTHASTPPSRTTGLPGSCLITVGGAPSPSW